VGIAGEMASVVSRPPPPLPPRQYLHKTLLY